MSEPPVHPPARAAVFLDRDGTLNEDPGYVHRPEDLALRPGVAEGLGILGRLGLPLIVVTNQGGIGRGEFTEQAMHAFNQALAAQARRHGARIEAFYWCPHHPLAVDERLRGPCGCRKPEPGLLVRAADEHGIDLPRSYLIGDAERDMEAARRVGTAGILVSPGAAVASRHATHVVSDFHEAGRLVRRMVAAGTPARGETPHA